MDVEKDRLEGEDLQILDMVVEFVREKCGADILSIRSGSSGEEVTGKRCSGL